MKHFTHDCKECTYVGSTPNHPLRDTKGNEVKEGKYDFYYHDRGTHIEYLARYGNKPEEYLSGIFHDHDLNLLKGLVLLGWQAGRSG